MHRELVERAKSGDADAFTQLVRSSAPRLAGVAGLILHDRERAKDAVQEALVAAWKDMRALRDPDAWDASVHDPVGVLGVVPRERLDALVEDPGFMRFLGEVRDEHQRYLDGDR